MKKVLLFLSDIVERWKVVLSLVLVVLFSFIIGYVVAMMHTRIHTDCLICSFFFEGETDLQNSQYEDDSETVERIFTIFFYDEGEIKSVSNMVRYPHSWKFKRILIHDEGNEIISEQKMYQISSPDDKMIVTILPYNVDYSSNILSTTTSLKQEISRICLVKEEIENSSEKAAVSIYRVPSNEMNFKYTQEIVLENEGVVKTRGMDNFIVYNRSKGISSSEYVSWVANIKVEFLGEPCDVQEYILVVDGIIKSLQIID
jgi:hypothetical protein